MKRQYTILKSMFLMLIIGLSFNSNMAWAYRQPAMESTLRELHRARESLAHAIPNKGGHREKALRLIDRAIREVQMGIEFANRHGNEKKKYNGAGDKRQYKDDRSNNERNKKEKVMEKRYSATDKEKVKEKELQEEAPAAFDKGKLERRY